MVAFVIAIAKSVLVIAVAVARSTFGGDVVDVRGSIGRVGWRRARVGVRRMRMRSMCRRCLRRPWWSKWVLMGFLDRGGDAAEELWNGEDAQDFGSSGENKSRGGVRVTSWVCFEHRYLTL